MKDFSKLWRHFRENIKPAAHWVRAFSSKLWQRFWELIDKIPFTFVLPLVALVAFGAFAVVAMVSEDIANYLQQLLGIKTGRMGKYDMLQTIGFCMAGILLVWQAWAANKRSKVAEDTAKNTDAGQQEERLKNAIEHLGHKKSASVRMGGAYGLFHLAKDAKDKGLKSLPQTVLKILCAHIRQTTTGQTATDQTATDQTATDQTATDQTATDQTATDQTVTGQTTGKNKYKEKYETKPSEEIQGLLTLLFVQKHDVFKGCPINLQGSYLNGADLRRAQLQKANLREAQLQGANLREAQLQGADLMNAQLQGADLMNAQLQGANLSNADSAPGSDNGKGD